jgi:hypothetical protein
MDQNRVEAEVRAMEKSGEFGEAEGEAFGRSDTEGNVTELST